MFEALAGIVVLAILMALMGATATSADRDVERSAGKVKKYLVDDGDVIYKGTLVFTNAGGYAVAPTDAANLKFVGVAAESADNAAGLDGTIDVLVEKEGEFDFVYAGGDATQALVGQEVYMQDNQTVDEDAALTTNDYKVGAIQSVESATRVRIRIDNYVR